MVSTQKPSFGFHKRVNLTFNDAVEKVKSALQAEGFGVLTEIDITQTSKRKIDADLGHRM